AILVLQAAGAQAQDKTNITGSDNVRKALESEEIDLYWEYTGTAWVSYLKQDKQVNDPEQLYQQVAERDAGNGITWWARSPANNTYAIAANPDAAKEHGVETLSDYAELAKTEPAAASTCMGPEFKSRNDGFPGLQKAYGFKLPARHQHEVSDAIVYTEAGKGDTCDFGSVATTDGRIAANDLVVLTDDKKFFPIYNPAITIRSELAEKYPELEQPFSAVAEKLTDDVLLGLNEQVSVEARNPKKVATEWMTEEGFIG
ncbi:MAG: glycine betaine ABC transporter substrate-binding protein, partial [Thermocrispum sp.]